MPENKQCETSPDGAETEQKSNFGQLNADEPEARIHSVKDQEVFLEAQEKDF